LLVVRKAIVPGTSSKAARSSRPNGLGAVGGNSPTMTGTATASRMTAKARARALASSAQAAASTGTRKLATSSSGLVR
jgi:hypothetical protein